MADKKSPKWMKMLGGGLLAGLPGAFIAGSMKKGGKVKKTGLYELHAGETVTPAKKSHKTLDQ